IHCYFEADERAYLKYSRLAKNGQRPSSRDVKNPVEIGLADEQGFPHKGWMDFVDNQFDAGTGTMVGRALGPNPDLILSPGLFACWAAAPTARCCSPTTRSGRIRARRSCGSSTRRASRSTAA